MVSIEFPDYLDHIRVASHAGSATCWPTATPRPGCPAAPTGTPPTCSGTSPRCSGSGRRRSGPDRRRRRRGARPGAARRRTTGCSPPSTSTPPALVAELERADPAEPAWSWSAEQTVGFTFRRQAHEALIHRLDAEQTAGDVTPLDAALASDGVLTSASTSCTAAARRGARSPASRATSASTAPTPAT